MSVVWVFGWWCDRGGLVDRVEHVSEAWVGLRSMRCGEGEGFFGDR